MKFISRNLPSIAAAMLTLAVGMTATSVFGQSKSETRHNSKSFCSDNNWSDEGRVSARDLREVTLAANGPVNVDGRKNGGISVKGEDRSDVLVRACIQAWGKTDESAKSAVANVKIVTGRTITAENSSDDNNWSVSYEIRVPRSTDLSLTAHNGGISITGVDGSTEFETQNGGVFLSGVSGTVKGRTTNGGVFVQLSGTGWNGSGLDVQTTNGGVNIEMPENYAAHVETGTVNGGFKSDIPSLNITTEDYKGDWSGRTRSRRISTNINGGGAPIKIITTNGGVKISTTDRSERVL
jgi:DUF4097 and DUF4098 domain-containing protein YvlB